MPVNEDPKYGEAAYWYCKFLGIKMSVVMRMVGFSDEEARSKKLQNRVRSRDEYKKMYRQRKLLSNFDVVIEKERDEASEITVSETLDDTESLSASTASSTSTMSHSSSQAACTENKNGPTTRSFVTQKDMEREQARAVRKRKSFALKEATIEYQREIEKENFQFSSPRKSARTIAKAIGQKHGTEVCYRSILENTEKGLFGQAPLKRGSTPCDYMISKCQMDPLKKEKKKRVEMERMDAAARELLSQNIAPSDLKKDQLVLLLQWHGIAKKDIPTNNPERLEKWLQVKDDTPPTFPKWTLEDEAEIAKLETPDMEHVAVCRQKTFDQFKAQFKTWSYEDQSQFVEYLKTKYCGDSDDEQE